MDISVLDISSVMGLSALCLLTANFLLGILLVIQYKRSTLWKKLPAFVKKIKIARVHNWTAYVALGLILLHPLLLLWNKEPRFSWKTILLPAQATIQPFWISIGIISLYALLAVIITSQKRIRQMMSFRLWKNIHLVSYLTAVFISFHGIFLDPELKNRAPDYFDGEKVVCEICLLILVAGMIWRTRFFLKQKRSIINKRISV